MLLRTFAAILMVLPLSAQAPAGSPLTVSETTTRDPEVGMPSHTRFTLAQESLEAGRAEEAVGHLLGAVAFHPASVAIWRELLRAAADDADARSLAAIRLMMAAADARGGAKLDRAVASLLPKGDAWPAKLTKARAAAAAELAKWVGKLPSRGRKALGNGIAARWAANTVLALGREMPALLTEHGPGLQKALDRFSPDHQGVLKALLALTSDKSKPTGSGEEGDSVALERWLDVAMRAARIVAGVTAQARFPKLAGPKPPNVDGERGAANEALARLRETVRELGGDPWTVEELQQLTPAERVAFTEEHGSWASPGVAVSPNGLYVIETTCGFDTLLGAAETVEKHHRRLVNWFGKEPFANRPGLVRLEPEHEGLESDGAPFWWAGGFQSGDVTTLRSSWQDVTSLGRGLTHELTHRFDGALFPFNGAWLIEGRAVWTAAHYEKIIDQQFLARLLQPGKMQGPFAKGYGREKKLRELIEGTIEDYRDNYSAGYALFAYLSSWRVRGVRLYASAIERYMKNARAGQRDKIGYFVQHFADGEDGRPAGFEAFAAAFNEFLNQCYRWAWDEKDGDNAWIETAYRTSLNPERNKGVFRDVPSWSWSRNRAEPWFGQDHARAAGALLTEVGEPKAAAAAFCWSVQTDWWRADVVESLAAGLDSARQIDAAWVARHEAARRYPKLFDAPAEGPMLKKLPKTRAYLAMLDEAAADYSSSSRALAAAALREERNRFGARFGIPSVDLQLPGGSDGLWPRSMTPRALGAFGWTEDGLDGYEQRRRKGLWFETDAGDVHVGRAKPRDDTGLQDRRANQRHAYVRSSEWQEPGAYVVRTRIHFTTSAVNGAVVFGTTRRERNLRLSFSAGDFLYAIGKTDEPGRTKSVRLSLDGRWERDRQFKESRPSTNLEFDKPSSYVDLELWVRGATVLVVAMGDPVFSYTTPDLSPIEGSIGFATSLGAIRVQLPTVQRLDAKDLGGSARGPGVRWDELRQHPMPELPTGPNGAIVLWVPPDEDGDTEWILRDVGRVLRSMASTIKDPLLYPQRWVLMLPKGVDKSVTTEAQQLADEIRKGAVEIIEHVREKPPEENPWVLFIDGDGVLRASDNPDGAMPSSVARWAEFYRPR